jgi:hypothetical protein
MSIFSDTNILTADDVNFLLDLLPPPLLDTPDIHIFKNWKFALTRSNKNIDLYKEYNLLKSIVQQGIFSTYNYQFNIIFIYLFNLPYPDPVSIKLHGAFCLFHEMRHHQQFTNSKTTFLSERSKTSSYSHLWVEKDANNYALKWLRRNREEINERFQFDHLTWDFRVNPNNRLRIRTNQIDISQKNDILI